MDRSDTGWQRCTGAWERLRWARIAAGYPRAKDLADSIGMKDGTYRSYERDPSSSKHSKFDDQLAMRFGRKLKVRWEWLLVGDGAPWADELPAGDRVRTALKGVMPDDEIEQIASLTELLDRKRVGSRG